MADTTFTQKNLRQKISYESLVIEKGPWPKPIDPFGRKKHPAFLDPGKERY